MFASAAAAKPAMTARETGEQTAAVVMPDARAEAAWEEEEEGEGIADRGD